MSGGVTLAETAFYSLSRPVPWYVWKEILYRRQVAQDGKEVNTWFWCKPCSSRCFSAGCFISLCSRKRILTQTVCRAISAVQTVQPQYVASNSFVKHMHQLYLFALKLWEPQTLLRKFSFYIDIKSLAVLSNIPCHIRQWAANLPWPMKLFRF